MLAAEFSTKARCSRYAAAARKNSNRAYCRTSDESSIIGGRKAARVKPTNPVTGPRIRVSHLKKIQQNAVPANTEGRRRTNSEVPTLRQRKSTRVRSGG